MEEVASPKAPKSPKSPAKSPKKEEAVAEEPKTEEVAKEEEKAPEPPAKPKKVFDAEWSADVKADKRPTTKDATSMNSEDSHLTLMVDGSYVTTIAADGWNCLMSGGRATQGVKAGRYMYEVRIHDVASPQDQQGSQWKTVRVGFGNESGAFIPGSDSNSIGLDNEGKYWADGKVQAGARHGGRWHTGDVIGVFVNLDPSSDHANTMSVFRNGNRLTPPQALPEGLKTAFPMIAVRNAAVSVRFGGAGARPVKELPFKARMWDDAAAADCVKSKVSASKDGKATVVVPIGLPDEGTGDFVDVELAAKHPGYVEISSRALAKQMKESGLNGEINAPASFKIAEFDNGKLLKALVAFAGTQCRNCIVCSVSDNLNHALRIATLTHFDGPQWTKKAVVAAGKPPKAFSDKVKATLIANMKAIQKKKVDSEKLVFTNQQEQKKKRAEAVLKIAQSKLDNEFKRKTAEFTRKKEAFEKRKTAAESSDPPKDFEEAEPTEPEVPEPAVAEDVEMVEEPDWEEKMKVDESAVGDILFCPRATFGDKEAQQKAAAWGLQGTDMAAEVSARTYANFTFPTKGPVPDNVDQRWMPEDADAVELVVGGEGFDAVEYAWEKDAAANKYLNAYKTKRKVQDKFVGLQIGPYFAETNAKWAQSKMDLRKKLQGYNLAVKARKNKRAAVEKAAAAPVEEKKEEEKEEKKEGEEEEEKKEEKKEDEIDLTVDDEQADMDMDTAAADLDIDSVDGKGTVLYRKFMNEDWTMMQARFELHHVLKCFAKDATEKDADRKGIIPSLLGHYYGFYLKKALQPQSYGQKSVEELLEYCEDIITVEDGVLKSKCDEEIPTPFIVKAAEEARQDRANRISAGDESAKLILQASKPQGAPAANSKGYGKGNKGGFQPRPSGFQPQPSYQAQHGQKRPVSSAAFTQAPFSQAAKRPAYGNAPRPSFQQGKGYGGKGYGGKGY